MAGPQAPEAGAGSDAFEQRDIGVPGRVLFDLGVLDLNGDDRLDVFTTNHNDRQGLLVNQGDGSFADRLTQLGLDQSPGFPGFELPGEPPMRRDGVYLFRVPGDELVEGALAVVVRGAPDDEVSGALEFLFPVKVNRAHRARVSTEVDTFRQPNRHMVRYTAHGGARIELEPAQMAAPIGVGLEAGYPLDSVFVGPRLVSPAAHHFALTLRDRHGIAWADLNRDGLLDAFITRGGLKGQVDGYRGVVRNQLMLRTGSELVDATPSSGLLTGTCRGRGTMPVDFNRDGLLDLFWACSGATPALFRGAGDGTFRDVSGQLDRGKFKGEGYAWLDVNGRGRDELIVVRERRIAVYRAARGRERRNRRWVRRDRIRTRGHADPRNVAIADFDADGDPDLFAPSTTGNTLIVNRAGRFRARGPARFGLPKTPSYTASWVDYDNDGMVDLHTTPQGLHRQVEPGRFASTGLAALPATTLDALATWFDYDNDGSRDAVLATAKPGGITWESSLLHNRAAGGHWLQIELSGPDGEYPVAGARVEVRTGDGTQTQWVGQNDGARYSRGHYRLYFGLGRYARARWIKVRWPDGSTRELRRVSADRLVRVSFPSGRGS